MLSCWPACVGQVLELTLGISGVSVRERIFRFIVCCAIHAGVLSLHVVRCMRADGQSEGLPSGIMVSLRVGWGATSFLVSSSRRDRSSTWFLLHGATEARFGFSFTARPRLAFASKFSGFFFHCVGPKLFTTMFVDPLQGIVLEMWLRHRSKNAEMK